MGGPPLYPLLYDPPSLWGCFDVMRGGDIDC